MSRRSRIRKRERKKRQHMQRPKQVEPIAAKISTGGLIADLARPLSSRAFDEALRETQHT
jgi:hypothetical protein